MPNFIVNSCDNNQDEDNRLDKSIILKVRNADRNQKLCEGAIYIPFRTVQTFYGLQLYNFEKDSATKKNQKKLLNNLGGNSHFFFFY